MDWKTLYQSRLMSAQEAVTHIKSGDRVVIGQSEPTCVVDAMVENREAYHNVEIVHMRSMTEAAYAQPGMEPYFHHTSMFVGDNTRENVNSGRGDFVTCFFYQVPDMLRTVLRPDVALIQVTPPDEHGYCSYGIAVDYIKAAAEAATVVIAQINRNVPRTLGDCFIHVSQMNCIVEQDGPVIEVNPTEITELERIIGQHCAGLVKDGDCLQAGFGAIPNAVLSALKDKRDLGVHSEMIADGVMELMEAGVITNARKNIHPGRTVISIMLGSRRLYDYVSNNPAFVMYPVDYVNDPYLAGQNDNLVSINSCLQVDFLGQVNAETFGTRQYGGIGGQVDFVRATAISKGGRSIIAMLSTAAGGKVSRIVPQLDPGAAVTTSRNDVEYIVTEYGVAHLKYRSNRERARALIAIAHPDFRPGLIQAFEERFHVAY